MNYNPAKQGRDLLRIKNGFTIEVESYDKEHRVEKRSITVESRNEARFWHLLLKFFNPDNETEDSIKFYFKKKSDFGERENKALEEFIDNHKALCFKFINRVSMPQGLCGKAEDLSDNHHVLYTLAQALIGGHHKEEYRAICRILISYHPTNVFISEIIFD